ncbi:pyruvate formate lyase activating enzyme [Dethiosulfatibacter aminovorans DSM 17477]|uniref:Pyruvate formate lyase activating enzyme n=1 Tax=Dethiosulfatibacter aminovorans DSM 17477 TaxID=1121476 RepID=A0A1M6C0T6_9FIRM|nr:glycyl-radical enzyme activating protein [Dethiosulfatibacter aminovorans]SHI54344.1 pyruvate formate lyase activating enzyme [Dethiosulfatibacter aminovorans DSM 17477]
MKNENCKGYISNIQRFSVNDGDGIRTTVFFTGCPLRCRWCANPETWNVKIGSREAEGIHTCEEMTVDQVVNEVKKDLLFYRDSGGGVTFSGGEASMQAGFLGGIVDRLEYLGVDMAIETCASFQWERMEPVLKKMDMIFVDIKTMDDEKHRVYCGEGNGTILENIMKMGSLDVPVVVRIPLMSGLNDDEENISRTADFVGKYLKKGRMELLPYHNLGEYKYDKLGLEKHTFEKPDKERIVMLEGIITESGVGLADFK